MAYIFNHTCIGASHIKKGIPCQDYSYSSSDDKCEIIIVSDGHGSDKYFRSDRGSRLAVEVAERQIRRFVETTPSFQLNDIVQLGAIVGKGASYDNLTLSEAKYEECFRRLCASIVSEWFVEIEKDWQTDPPTDEQMKRVPANYIQYFKNNQNLEKAYGATLLAFVKTPSYWFALHLGDGKCISFNSDGNWSEPVLWDPE